MAVRAKTVRTQEGRQHMGAHTRASTQRRDKAVRCTLRCIAVLAAFFVAYFLSEWLVTGAATLSIGRFLFLASNDVESL